MKTDFVSRAPRIEREAHRNEAKHLRKTLVADEFCRGIQLPARRPSGGGFVSAIAPILKDK